MKIAVSSVNIGVEMQKLYEIKVKILLSFQAVIQALPIVMLNTKFRMVSWYLST
jgi:hypothetical protein